MENAFAGTLHLRLRPSKIQQGMAAALHLLALLVLVGVSLSRPWFAMVMPVVVLSAWRAHSQACLRPADAITRLRWPADDRWAWQCVNGHWHEGRLASAFTLGTTLVVLGLRNEGRRFRLRYCVCFSDAVTGASHRHLRARLTVRPPSKTPKDD